MAADLDERSFREVQEQLGLPHPALVEKDYYVVKALQALSKFTVGEPRLVFGGGTALCRGRRLIQRMSEDIDLKAVRDGGHTRAQRKAFKERVNASLLEAGFKFDPKSQKDLAIHNDHKMLIYHLPYPAITPSVGSLRQEIRIDVSFGPLYCEPEGLAIRSFVAEAFEEEAEIASFPCVAVTETLAEKFVALTRRVGHERLKGGDRDHSLLRHIYDLYCLRDAYSLADIEDLLHRVIESERTTHARSYLAYMQDPLGEITKTLAEMREDADYAASFREFQRDMVYGQHLDFDAGMDHLDEIGRFLARERLIA